MKLSSTIFWFLLLGFVVASTSCYYGSSLKQKNGGSARRGVFLWLRLAHSGSLPENNNSREKWKNKTLDGFPRKSWKICSPAVARN